MPSNSNRIAPKVNGMRRDPRFWLQVTGLVLAILNGAALFLYLDPPGGSREQLQTQAAAIRSQIAASRGRLARLQTIAAKVQVGSVETDGFETKYFLPKRVAYVSLIAEIQRMAKDSGLQERDGVYTEEPIEGTDNLALLSNTANYQGSYDNLMRFLHEADQSPMMLMLDMVQAAPQQRGNEINASMRFQAIVTENANAALEGQP